MVTKPADGICTVRISSLNPLTFERDPLDPDCTADVVCPGYYLSAGGGDPSASAPPSECEGNPCDPASGGKTETDFDDAGGGNGTLRLSRHYDNRRGGLWRTSYAGLMSQDSTTTVTVTLSSLRSSAYGTTEAACLQGWLEIKDTLWGGSLASASTEYAGGNRCRAYQGSRTLAWFNIQSNVPADYAVFPTPPPTLRTLVRPDGSSYTFRLVNGAWVDDLHPEVTFGQGAGGWVFTAADGVRETYADDGRLLSITRPDGLSETLTYDLPTGGGGDGDPSTLDRVTDSSGRSLSFSYTPDAQGRPRLSSATTPDGLIQYTYDAQGNLETVSHPDATKKTYHYEDPRFPHHLTGISDENGDRYATWAYDDQGRATLSEHAGGAEKVEMAYNTDGSTTVTGVLGDRRTYRFGVHGGALRTESIDGDRCATCPNNQMKTRTYDANGFLSQYTDWNGYQTTLVNDDHGREVSRTEAVGTPEQRTLETDWHPRLRLPVEKRERDAHGGLLRTTRYTYDGDNNSADAKGDLTRKEVIDNVLNKSRVWTWTYTYHASVPGALLQKVEDGPRSDVADLTTYDYYPPNAACTGGATGNNLGCRSQLMQVTNALDHVTQVTRYNAHGQPEEILDPNGLVTTLAYDARQRLLSRTVGSETTTYAYDGVGNLTHAALPDGETLSYTYDAAHRLTGIQDGLGNQVAYTLDGMGNRIKEDVHDPAGALAQTRGRVYDALDRLSQELGAQNQTTNYQYDANGNRTGVTDPLGHATASGYDARNRLVQVTDPRNGVTRYTYDALDNLTAVTDPKGLTTTYTYDGLGNLLRETSPDRGTTTYTYDAAGNLKSKTDARGWTVTYSYDALNRLIHVSDSTSQGTTYQYDEGANGRGRLTRVTDPWVSTTTLSHDPYGAVTGKQQMQGNNLILSLTYAYDAGGRPSQLAYPSGKLVTYSYNQGKINHISVNGQPLLDNLQYHPNGQPQAWSWGNGTAYSRAYDANGWLQGYSLGNLPRTLTYDATGRIVGYSHPGHPDLDQGFGYDELDRLTGAVNNQGGRGYQYDANGNRSQLQSGANTYPYTYVAGSNRLQSFAGALQQSYSYDAAGRMTGDGTRGFYYDNRGRLISASNGNAAARYQLNGLGQRIGKSPVYTGAQTYFAYDESGHLLGEYDGNGQAIQETVWLGDTPVAVLKGPSVYYVYADHLNAPRLIADSQNQAVWRWDNAEPFGLGQPDQNPSGLGVFNYNLRLPGQYYDQETGLHYNYFRNYDPATGRYIEPDPIGLAGGLNPYSYVRGNPISRVDPLGLSDLVFDRGSDTLTAYNNQGQQVGQFPAGNNTTSNSNGPWQNGTYDFSHYVPHPESGANGPYGSNGNFVFDVPGRTGMGVHSGRSGPQSKTQGCIRTTDDATDFLRNLHGSDPLQTITVR